MCLIASRLLQLINELDYLLEDTPEAELTFEELDRYKSVSKYFILKSRYCCTHKFNLTVCFRGSLLSCLLSTAKWFIPIYPYKYWFIHIPSFYFFKDAKLNWLEHLIMWLFFFSWVKNVNKSVIWGFCTKVIWKQILSCNIAKVISNMSRHQVL